MRTIAIVLILGLTASSVMSTTTCAGENAYSGLLTGLTGTNALATSDIILSTDTAATTVTAAGAFAKCGEYVTTVGSETKICVSTEAKFTGAVQQYLDNLVDTLEGLAGTRDKYIIEQRGTAIKALASLRRLNEIADDATIPTAYATYGALFVNFADEIAKNFTAIVANFEDYQKERATCMGALVQSQGALLCSAMTDATITGITKTASSEAATFDDDFIDQLAAKCYNYFTYSARQSSVIYSSLYSSGLSSFVSAIEKLINKDASGATEDLVAAWAAFDKVSVSSTAVQQPVQMPASCTAATSCRTFIDGLFSATGILDNTKAIQGGDATALSFTRLLREEGNERRLATGGIDADLTKYSFTTTFEENPGNVDNTQNANSALRNGIVACVVAALALVF